MNPPVMPTETERKPGLFDRIADAVAKVAARAWFFAACVALIVIWLPSYFVVGSVDTWQLLINTATTIVTFLLVALLQNTSARADQAVQHKLNASAKAQLLILTALGYGDSDEAKELRTAIGLEQQETAG
jgi:low affinity Fe/Cu permease